MLLRSISKDQLGSVQIIAFTFSTFNVGFKYNVSDIRQNTVRTLQFQIIVPLAYYFFV